MQAIMMGKVGVSNLNSTMRLMVGKNNFALRGIFAARSAGRSAGSSFAYRLRGLLLLGLLGCGSPAYSLIEIEVTKGGFNAIPIAVVPFGWSANGSAPEDVAQIISSDLARSGLMAPVPRNELISRPVSGDVPNYSQWRLAGIDYLVIGAVKPKGRQFVVDFQLFDPIRQKLLSGYSYTVAAKRLRGVSHQIADVIFEDITGIRGAFNTEIAFVSVTGSGNKRQYQMQLADADGLNSQAMLTSPRPILSPSWSPDGKKLAYVSFEDRERSAIYVQDRSTGRRTKIISQSGINGAPSWSPDGNRLAVVLSYEGNPDIYLIELTTLAARRVTRSQSIDTEPEWLDNSTLVFTSDRSGGPQLYRIPVTGGQAKRLTFEGRYNASASVAPDQSSVAMVHRDSDGYKIALLRLDDGEFTILSSGRFDESPSFSPNGQMVLFATSRNGRQTLGAVSVDGQVEQSLTLEKSNVREPAWSPFSN